MLAKIGKADLLGQLATTRRMAALDGAHVTKWDVRIARSTGRQDSVYGVRTDGGTDWICPLDPGAELLRRMMSAVLGGERKAMDLDGLVGALSASDATDVAIGWPSNKRRAIVVKVFAVAKGGLGTVYLFPGPADIDRVNEEIRDYVRTHGCASPEHSGDCGKCPRLMECGVLEDAEREVKERRKTCDGKD